MEQQYFTTQELVEKFGKTRATLWRWGKSGKFPPPTRKFGRPLWHIDDINNFRGES